MSVYELVRSVIPDSVKRATVPIQLWETGVTPLSTGKEVAFMSVLYLVVVLGGQELMRNFRPVPARVLRLPFIAHNILLSLSSGLLLWLILEETLPFVSKHGWHKAICRFEVTTDRLELFYIVNYYFKYWELMDTMFLVLKKKKLLFLHVYHHMATAALCYTQIAERTPMAWTIISLNLAVHVAMYGYYALTSMGISCPWKRYITVAQITQFFLDLYLCFWGTYNHYASKWNLSWLPYYGHCDGDEFAAWMGILILSSYLVLFLFFYKSTYKKKGALPPKKAN